MDAAPMPWIPAPGGPPSLAALLRSGPLGARRVVGSCLGPYVVEGELGRGGMGVVYRARHQPTGRAVALKVLLAASGASERQRRRFSREALLGDAHGGEGVVQTLDAGEVDGLLFIALELVEGGSLGEALARGIERERFLAWFTALCRTLARAHARGLVHRDLKPDNVLLRASDGAPLLSDFGLARDLAESSSLTKTGAAVGTPAYMAPEQIRGDPPTPAFDVYALGTILYEGLTGRVPIEAPNIALRYAAILSRPPEPPSTVAPDVPPWLDAVCLRALAADPAARYPDAGALLAALEAGAGVGARSRAWLIVGASAAAAALALALVVATALRGAPREDGAPSAPSPPAPSEARADPAALEEERALARLAQVLLLEDDRARYERACAVLPLLPATSPARAPLQALVDDLRPWRRRELAGELPPLHAMRGAFAWDARRGRLLLFGGGYGLRPDGVVNDLRAFDGASWAHLDPPIRPEPRFGHAAAYDVARDRLVLAWGNDLRWRPLSDQWEWDGEAWHLVRDGPGPKRRAWHSLSYDPARQVVVLFAGRHEDENFDDLWEWDGKVWTERTPAERPAPRHAHGAVCEPSGRLLVFGGLGEGKFHGDTWAWDGERWARVAKKGPSARSGMGLVHDGTRALLFGGIRDERVYDDTWVFEGERWVRRHPLVKPPARAWHALGWDPARQVAVLVGGWDGERSLPLTEVWEYGPGLDPRAPPEQRSGPLDPEERALAELGRVLLLDEPQARYEAARALVEGAPTHPARAVVDELRPWRRVELKGPAPAARDGAAWAFGGERLLLFGGWTGRDDGLLNDTWSYDGRGWTSHPATIVPHVRYAHAGAWDPARGRLVVFAGNDHTHGRLIDLWEWDGAGWAIASQGDRGEPRAQPRAWHAMVYDAARERVVLFGGFARGEELGDLWAWDGRLWTELTVPGGPSARSGHAMAYDPVGRRVLVFGGWDGQRLLNDLWAWDGEGWSELAAGAGEPRPPTRNAAAVAHDGERLLVYGGAAERGELGDTWVFEGGRWRERQPITSPGKLAWHGVAWDARRGAFVLYGGSRRAKKKKTERPGEVWEY